jgi:hypothetical protein
MVQTQYEACTVYPLMKELIMEPINNVIKQSIPEDVIEKKKWITPEIEVHDIVEITQSGPFVVGVPVDGALGYS